jgi:predicted glycosyltransferase
VLVVQGTADEIVGAARGPAVAAAIPGARLLTMGGAGHAPQLRDPVRFNLELSRFIGAAPPSRTWTRARNSPRRVLYVSSPIGLGHAQRDIAIARALRQRVPGLQIDWLAQDPVTRVLEASGERIHPASLELASESQHIEAESAGHDLHCFQAVRRMDEILIANFMVFHDLTAAEPYDLYFPLKHHFEQNYHVRHRLDRYGAGRCMDFDTATPEVIAQAIAEEIGKPVSYRDVETDGAARAAALIAEML